MTATRSRRLAARRFGLIIAFVFVSALMTVFDWKVGTAIVKGVAATSGRIGPSWDDGVGL